MSNKTGLQKYTKNPNQPTLRNISCSKLTQFLHKKTVYLRIAFYAFQFFGLNRQNYGRKIWIIGR